MASELFRSLAEREDVDLLAPSDAPSSLGEGHRIRRSPFPGFLGFLIWICALIPIESIKLRYDWVLSVNAMVASVVRFCDPFHRMKHSVLVFGSDVTYPNRLYQRGLRFTLSHARLVFAISRYVQDLCIQRGASSSNLALLPPGIDADFSSRPTPSTTRKPGAPVVLFVGRLIPRKGLSQFVTHCLPLILTENDVEVWVVGGDATGSLGHNTGELLKIKCSLRGKPYSEKVRFLGSLNGEDLRAAYSTARVLILPAVEVANDIEGFGIVFLEAATFAVPAVSSAIGGIPDAVVHGETGLLVPSGDWHAFAREVVRLVSDDDLHQRLGRRARERALRDHSWTHLACVCSQELSRASQS